MRDDRGRETPERPEIAPEEASGTPERPEIAPELDEEERRRIARVQRRLELVEKEDQLLRLLKRTRLTVAVWAAGVVFFVWTGWATGNWPPALVMAFFSALATAVNFELRRGRKNELRTVQEELERLPSP